MYTHTHTHTYSNKNQKCKSIKNMKILWHIMLYYFKKGKNRTETQKRKDLCSVWRRCCN